MFIFDAHLDLAMNAIEWNRDLTRSLAEIRRHEQHLRDKRDRGRGTVCLPELRLGGIHLVVATLIARIEHNAYSPVPGWASPSQAWAMTQAQRAWYRAMEEAGQMTLVTTLEGLNNLLHDVESRESPRHAIAASTPSGATSHVERSEGAPAASSAPPSAIAGAESHSLGADSEVSPVGFILSLEGADSILTPGHLERAWNDGLRVLGPAHYGPGVYANGTNAPGGFNSRGRELLREMDRLGFILDATHLSDECFWEALDLFQGPVWASHHNCRALVPHQRQLSDDMIRALIARGAVIGAALDAWMLVPDWVRGTTTPQSAGVTLDHVIRHTDHVCQLAGNARHAGIGSDLDGAFGTEQTPQDLDSIADLRKIPELLRARGYSQEDIAGIAHGNLVRFLRGAWD